MNLINSEIGLYDHKQLNMSIIKRFNLKCVNHCIDKCAKEQSKEAKCLKVVLKLFVKCFVLSGKA